MTSSVRRIRSSRRRSSEITFTAKCTLSSDTATCFRQSGQVAPRQISRPLEICRGATCPDCLKQVAVSDDKVHLAVKVISDDLRLLDLILRTELVILRGVGGMQIICRDVQSLARVHGTAERI